MDAYLDFIEQHKEIYPNVYWKRDFHITKQTCVDLSNGKEIVLFEVGVLGNPNATGIYRFENGKFAKLKGTIVTNQLSLHKDVKPFHAVCGAVYGENEYIKDSVDADHSNPYQKGNCGGIKVDFFSRTKNFDGSPAKHQVFKEY